MGIATLAEDAANDYRLGIRAAARGLWSGVLDLSDFLNAMQSNIRRGLARAWAEGMKDCGIQPDEMTPEERVALEQAIQSEFRHIFGFGEAIEAMSRANGGLLGVQMQRAEMWIARYRAVVVKANAMACRDRKKEWALGPTEHCDSCLKLAGKVKRASFWATAGILPRQAGAVYLKCRGYKCQCDLVDTDKPVSRGPLPACHRQGK